MAIKYPEITHGLCGFHMNMNLKNRFKSQVVCNLFHEASRAHRELEFLEKMQELSRVNMRAYDYLMRVRPHRWSRAYYPVRHYQGMTSNILECKNNCLRHARQLPITTLVQYIRGSVKRNLWTSVLISTKQTPGWKAILVSSFPLDTLANGILLLKYIPKLFFHQGGELKLVGRERIGFHLQVNMVVRLDSLESVAAKVDETLQVLEVTLCIIIAENNEFCGKLVNCLKQLDMNSLCFPSRHKIFSIVAMFFNRQPTLINASSFHLFLFTFRYWS
ncbi:hypothetical protein EZV62_024482 [Acer yangbiense]|uniref:Uncharacterized protein n=1 Tax=Acer yangbiense TaxID=1000413 RepID=A0A5C7GVU1_9ROSI|nr:hypothetical protein EZV62_024482 [Acer yangbiense]